MKEGERGGLEEEKRNDWLLQENKPRPRRAKLPLSLKAKIFFPLFYSEYVKIIDGSGTTVFTRYGYSTTPQKHFAEVSFGNSENITVQIYLDSRNSNARLQFGILQQGLQSG